jgi:hypothetical protein
MRTVSATVLQHFSNSAALVYTVGKVCGRGLISCSNSDATTLHGFWFSAPDHSTLFCL